MNVKETARRFAVLGNLLVTASLFFALIWWWVSVSLFVAGSVTFGLAWMLDGALKHAPSIVHNR